MRLRSRFPAKPRLRPVLVRHALIPLALACALIYPASAFAQQAPTPPDAPQPAQSSQSDQSSQPTPQSQSAQDERLPQTKRILGVIPNFRAVSTDEKLPPQTVKEKFMTATSDSFDYSAIFVPVVLAGYNMGTNAYPQFGDGADAFGRYLWHSAADQTIENYMVEFVVPVVARQDTRYYTLGRGGFFKRTGYALSRVIITRSDAGNEVFNVSEVAGAGAAAGISTTYYPTRERTIGTFGSSWGINVGVDAASFVAKEFWPDIYSHVFQRKSTVDPQMR